MGKDSVLSLRTLGDRLNGQGKYEEAIKYLNLALEIDPNDCKTLNFKGVALNELKLYEEAIECLDKSIEINPNDYFSLSVKANTLNKLEREEEAIDFYNLAIAAKPNDVYSLSGKGVSLSNLERYEEAIESFDQALKITPYNCKCLRNKASSLAKLGQDYKIEYFDRVLKVKPYERNFFKKPGRHKEAIELYDKVLNIEINDIESLCGKANSLNWLRQYEEAIECYDVVLKIDPNHIQALNGKGISLSWLDRYTEAIEYFDKALKINPKNDDVLTNKGIILKRMGQYEDANKCFDKAINIKEDNWIALVNKALLLEYFGEDKKAIEIYNLLLNKMDKNKEMNLIELVNFKKHALQGKDEDTKTDVLNDIINNLHDKQDEFFSTIGKIESQFKRFIDTERSIPKNFDSFLAILRKWNSYTPILPSKKGDNKGGGYFLFHHGKGIVIDPGFNFVENFYQEGFKVADIDAVIITHAHNDHTVDLESILTLVYKHNDAIEDAVKEEMKDNNIDEIKQETENRLKTYGKKIDLFLNLGTFMKYSGWLNLKDSNEVNSVTVLMPNTEYKLPKDYCGIKLYATQAKHHEVIDEKYPIGFILEINNKQKIGFTGDTGWDWDRGETMVKPFKEKKPQLVVAHLGAIKRKEFDYVLQDSDTAKNGCFYSHHLGLLGITRFLEETHPTLSIVSEFGEELRGQRSLIVESIANTLNLNILPGDIGLYIKLSDLSIYCFIKEDFVDYKTIEVYTDPEDDGSTLHFYGRDPDHQRFNKALKNKANMEPTPIANRTKSYHSSS